MCGARGVKAEDTAKPTNTALSRPAGGQAPSARSRIPGAEGQPGASPFHGHPSFWDLAQRPLQPLPCLTSFLGRVPGER